MGVVTMRQLHGTALINLKCPNSIAKCANSTTLRDRSAQPRHLATGQDALSGNRRPAFTSDVLGRARRAEQASQEFTFLGSLAPCGTLALNHAMLYVMDVSATELKRAVEAQHGCTATVFQSVPIKETFGRNTVWEGVVHIFSLTGHPTAKRAYAWSSPVEGSDKRRLFTVLHQSQVTFPVEAVRAAILAEDREKKRAINRNPQR